MINPARPKQQEPMNVISLGAGVDSSTMAMLATEGEITPMPDIAIYADTQADPKSVYKWLKWLEKHLPFPIIRVTAGNLAEKATTIRTSKNGKEYHDCSVPAYIHTTIKRGRMIQRQCTKESKIRPVKKELHRIRNRRPIIQWLGITIDEASRMKPSKVKWITHRWPLIELGMSRQDCLDWMKDHGYPEPPRSACVFCPYQHDTNWNRLKLEAPEDFAEAVRFDYKNREMLEKRTKGKIIAYVHKSLKPLDEVDFLHEQYDSTNAFNNECEGRCGT